MRHINIENIIYGAAIVALALFIGWVIRRLILWIIPLLTKKRHSGLGKAMLNQHILSRCSHILPPLIIIVATPFAIESKSLLFRLFNIAINIYLIIAITIVVNSIIRFTWTRYNERKNIKNLPLGGILNICTGAVWVISTIIIGSVILDKSPIALLTGLGAFTAALMLIFKDSILGFVAGVQLSQNDMLRIGDWIVVPSTIANGIVVDMSLTAVKVQNWDNTIVTLPPYTLISTSFQNWRGMSDSGWRLISRSVIFDVNSVRVCSEELLSRVSKIPQMNEFITKIKSSGQFYDSGLATINGTIQTNLGLLRAYMCQYLINHPLISSDQQILVRVMTPDSNGMPLQIYCYTTTAWTAYEAVQSEIFEHIAAIAPIFELRLFNNPSGHDFTSLRQTPDYD